MQIPPTTIVDGAADYLKTTVRGILLLVDLFTLRLLLLEVTVDALPIITIVIALILQEGATVLRVVVRAVGALIRPLAVALLTLVVAVAIALRVVVRAAGALIHPLAVALLALVVAVVTALHVVVLVAALPALVAAPLVLVLVAALALVVEVVVVKSKTIGVFHT